MDDTKLPKSLKILSFGRDFNQKLERRLEVFSRGDGEVMKHPVGTWRIIVAKWLSLVSGVITGISLVFLGRY